MPKCSICGRELELSEVIEILNPEQASRKGIRVGDYVCWDDWHRGGFYEYEAPPPELEAITPRDLAEVFSRLERIEGMMRAMIEEERRLEERVRTLEMRRRR